MHGVYSSLTYLLPYDNHSKVASNQPKNFMREILKWFLENAHFGADLVFPYASPHQWNVSFGVILLC